MIHGWLHLAGYDLPIDELAQITNLPAGTVKSRLHRARGLLREVIQLLPASDAERRTAEQILTDLWAEYLRIADPESEPDEAGNSGKATRPA